MLVGASDEAAGAIIGAAKALEDVRARIRTKDALDDQRRGGAGRWRVR